jgi:hypothetical protein
MLAITIEKLTKIKVAKWGTPKKKIFFFFYKQNRRFSLGGAKKIPTVGVFPTVLVFSYGQINPMVKMPRLTCTQFVVPRYFTHFFFKS